MTELTQEILQNYQIRKTKVQKTAFIDFLRTRFPALRVETGMGRLATVVAIAPMLGLLGTVWGVLDAFANMGATGSATIATMAPAIASALVTTVVGLLIAIPGVMLHNWLSAMLRDLLADMEGFADDLMGRIALEFQDPGRGA